MQPANLTLSNFVNYPPLAHAQASAHLSLLRQLPLVFLPSLLRELIDYDYKFSAERTLIDRQFTYLELLSTKELAQCFTAFSQIRLTADQSSFDWCGRPLDFTERLSAFLWQTHQMDTFRDAALLYGSRLQSAIASPEPIVPRMGVAVIGQGASPLQPGLFQKLREHGTLFTHVVPENGLSSLLASVEARAQSHPASYAHWYVDGGILLPHSKAITGISYASLAPARAALFQHIQKQVSKPGMGPEELRDSLTQLSPAELGMKGDPLLDRFQVKLLTEGSGTQIFSTTFVQWTAREALRRAEPLTLLVRFTPRQRQRPMNELLAGDESTPQLDPEGSLIDGDMAAYYQWINQQRLPGARQASFLVWFEGQRLALAVGPTLARAAESKTTLSLAALISLIAG